MIKITNLQGWFQNALGSPVVPGVADGVHLDVEYSFWIRVHKNGGMYERMGSQDRF